ncbi:iron chelate uptake ABC transporter family permease subunit [Bacillus licheniformis]|nr:iron chelate uptake ABC transporter family permease subunit [Bacillus licheniformis]
MVALFAGICLAAAGSILQGLIRNPLASPDIIGVTGGLQSLLSCFNAVSDKTMRLQSASAGSRLPHLSALPSPECSFISFI